MIIRVLSTQIPKFWEQIKFVATVVDRIHEKDRELYLNRLLHALLSDKAQCFIRFNGNKELQAMAITRLIQDEVTGEKTLFLNALYSFKGVDDTEWKTDSDYMIKFAKMNGCKKFTAYSNNQRVFEIAKMLGFEERFRSFVLRLE